MPHTNHPEAYPEIEEAMEHTNQDTAQGFNIETNEDWSPSHWAFCQTCDWEIEGDDIVGMRIHAEAHMKSTNHTNPPELVASFLSSEDMKQIETPSPNTITLTMEEVEELLENADSNVALMETLDDPECQAGQLMMAVNKTSSAILKIIQPKLKE